jgi:hypothetical protein
LRNKEKIFGILGGGFGLYGYLVAIKNINKKNKIITLEKYRNLILKRNDLKKFKNEITFVNSQQQLVKNSTHIVFARRPSDQKFFLKNFLKKKLKKKLFLEKPITENPKNSIKILNQLIKRKINFKIGFLFTYQSWFKFILDFHKDIKIEWKFISSDIKKKTSWKLNNYKSVKFEGGLINFYGIHIIYILTFLKNPIIKKSLVFKNIKTGIFFKWILIVIDEKRTLTLELDINSNEDFKIIFGNKTVYRSGSPFENRNYSDSRISSLILHLKDKSQYLKNYVNHIKLWKEILDKTNILNV